MARIGNRGHFLILLLVTGFVFGQIWLNIQPRVLGLSSYLADNHDNGGGNDDRERSRDTSDNNTQSAPIIQETTPDPTVEPTAQPTPQPTHEPAATVSDTSTTTAPTDVVSSTLVQCTGPNGITFETDYEDCVELNQQWEQPVQYVIQVQQQSQSSGTTRTVTAAPTRRPTPAVTRRSSSISAPVPAPASETEGGADAIFLLAGGDRPPVPPVDKAIRVWSKDQQRRVNLTSGRFLAKLEHEESSLVIRAQSVEGEEIDLERGTLGKIDSRLVLEGIKLASASGAKVVLLRNKVGAVTDLPVAVDLATNDLFIETEAGDRLVALLPDQAVANLGVDYGIKKLGVTGAARDTQPDESTSVQKMVNIVEIDGVPAYELIGLETQKLFGFLEIDISTTYNISVEDGTLVSADRPLLMRLLDLISS